MFYILGLLLATGSLVASIIHLGQAASSYYDFVGVTMVIGGTSATALITLPWDINRQIMTSLWDVIRRPLSNRKQLLLDCMKVNEEVLKSVYRAPAETKGLAHRILRDGVELIQLGFSTDKIDTILQERLFQSTDRARYVGNSIRALAKYPPAFGLAGTVLGLVHLMRGVSDGMSPQETGVRMAIALVATFYGLLVANLVVSPLGDAVVKNATDEEKLGEIAMQSILLASDRTNLLETQELLNSFVEDTEKVDVLGLSGPTVETVETVEEVKTEGAA